MRYITENDLKIFEEEEQLDKDARAAKQVWLNEVKKSYNGEMKYDETKPSFDLYIEAHNKWKIFFESYDAIIMPVSFVPPFKHIHEGDFSTRSLVCNGEERAYAELVSWTILTGMAYLPSTVPPLGLGASGLPIGFQVVGPYGSDYSTIRLAGYIGELTGGYQAPGIVEG